MAATGNNADGEVEVTFDFDASEFERQMHEIGQAWAAVVEAIAERWQPVIEALTAAFDPIYCIDPGGPYSQRAGRPIRTAAEAAEAVAYARDTVMVPGKRLPKALRAYAKRRRLACRAILGAEGVRGVATNQFLST